MAVNSCLAAIKTNRKAFILALQLAVAWSTVGWDFFGCGAEYGGSRIAQAQSPAARLKLPRVIVSSGGPYVSAGNSQIQQFKDSITVPSRYATQPLSLVFTNGSERSIEYDWLRVFLLPGGEDANLAPTSQPAGRLLIDEHSFLATPQVYVDLTGQLLSGENNIAIEGVGNRGATFRWELRSIAAPELLPARPEVYAGGTFIIYGSGFSARNDENLVQLGDGTLPVLQSSFSELELKIPPGWPPGTYELTVSLQTYRSKPISVVVVKPPTQR